MTPFSATARLQFHKGFTMDDAAALVPYYASLGISHFYASPLLKSRSGSTHGYDIVDHNQVDPELGGEDALRRMVQFCVSTRWVSCSTSCRTTWASAAMTMPGGWTCWNGAAPQRTPSILTSTGIRPTPPCAAACSPPFLGAPYGDCLMNGELTLKFDPADGRFFASYYTHRFPINPRDYPSILLTEAGPLEEPAAPLTNSPPPTGRRPGDKPPPPGRRCVNPSCSSR